MSKWIAGVVGSSDKVNVYTEEEIMTILDAGEKEGSIEEDEILERDNAVIANELTQQFASRHGDVSGREQRNAENHA